MQSLMIYMKNKMIIETIIGEAIIIVLETNSCFLNLLSSEK